MIYLSRNLEQKLVLSSPKGMSRSIFPHVQAMLGSRRALVEEAPEPDHMAYYTQDDFVDLLDWFYCAMLPCKIDQCLAWYAGKGPRAKDLYSEWELAAQSNVLLSCLSLYEALERSNQLHKVGLVMDSIGAEMIDLLLSR